MGGWSHWQTMVRSVLRAVKFSAATRRTANRPKRRHTVTYTDSDIVELKRYCTSVSRAVEGDCTYILLEGLILPEDASLL